MGDTFAASQQYAKEKEETNSNNARLSRSLTTFKQENNMASKLCKLLGPVAGTTNVFLITEIDPNFIPDHPLPPWEPPKPPLGIWGPNDPRPTHPISGIPGLPGYEPPRPPDHIWGGGNEPFPTPPIVIVPPPDWKPPEGVTPPDPGEIKPIGGLQPVQPITMPDFILVKYPGYGWVAVGKPVPPTEPEKK